MNPNRFLNFGAASGGSNGASANAGGGSGAGSGNFLFDIIRVSRKFNEYNFAKHR